MHEGRFPAPYDPCEPSPVSSKADLLDDAPAVEGPTRRAWLFGMGGMMCVALVSATTILGGRNKPGPGQADPHPKPRSKPRPKQPAAPPDRGSLAWALAMEHAGDEQLIQASGDLEMVSARHRKNPLLLPIFVRLLDVTLKQDSEHADVAGACAVRSLARLGRPQLALRRRAEISEANRPETQAAIDSVLRRLGRHRR